MRHLRSLFPVALVTSWAVRTHQDACRNARGAATDAARRRLERAEVEQYLDGLVDDRVAAHS